MSDEQTDLAAELMESFVERSGVVSDEQPDRYLWTDAFAVLNLLALDGASGDLEALEAAEALIEQVHLQLGRHRADDARSGWISGLSDQEGRRHPTAGGLRIGKELPERPEGEPIDRREEWDRDGQYFHYNTKWAMALERASRGLHDPKYNRWGRELMVASRDGFVYEMQPDGSAQMYWKVRIDLSEPLVHSMGQLDPLDGFETCRELVTATDVAASNQAVPTLEDEIETFRSMLEPRDWRTSDPLGLGGVLMQAFREWALAESSEAASTEREPKEWLAPILQGASVGLEQYEQNNRLGAPPEGRLAFREFGLAIGLALADRLANSDDFMDETATQALEEIGEFSHFRDDIVDFWLEPERREVDIWREHQNINEVMLASALLGDRLLTVGSDEEEK